LFVNIYAPNSVQDQCCFYENLNKKIEENIVGKENKIIIGGDFNVTLDPTWDCSGGNQTKKASVKYIEDLCLDFDLTNINFILAYQKPGGQTFYLETKETSYTPFVLKIQR